MHKFVAVERDISDNLGGLSIVAMIFAVYVRASEQTKRNRVTNGSM